MPENRTLQDGGDWGRRWWGFLRERFPPTSSVPMILVFALANAGVALRLSGGSSSLLRGLGVATISLLFFFRLRCFDEIKDYETDCCHHPMRPLARGLLTRSHVKRMCWALAFCELALAGLFGWKALVTHTVTVGYSFLMYREFFIGRWLRPRLTLYAVTHTLVSMLMGWSISATVCDAVYGRFPPGLLRFGLVNWMLFNVFEFARKTFAPGEEIQGSDSYSLRFGPRAALVLCLSQVAAAVFILRGLPVAALATRNGLSGWVPHAALALLPLAGAIVHAVQLSHWSARLYRGASLAYQFLFYALILFQSGVRG
ncbi:MAG: manganese transporter permease [Kiritimatiellia bacterium]|nr:manganese transporter permease [Kiritimatiellia bacterium]